MNEQNNKSKKHTLKIGSFSIVISLVVLAVVIAANLLVSSLPAWLIRPDTTKGGLFTISDTTKEIAAALDTDVTLYHITQPDNANVTVQEILQRYADMSTHIKVVEIDPVAKPTFISEYTSAEQIAENSIIAVSDKRSTIIDGNALYMYKLPGDDINYYSRSEYEYYYQMFAYQGKQLSAEEYFFGENELTRALDYVTTEELPVLYVVGGHGELQLTETFASAVADENVEMRDLTLLAGETQGVPEDAAAIIINVPQTDITEEELTILKTYLNAGGNILLTTFFQFCTADTVPNIASLAEYMGLTATADVVLEGDNTKYYQSPSIIIPTLTEQGLGSNLPSTNISTYMANAHPITNTQSNENVTTVPLMTTSDTAYLSAEAEKEDKASESFTLAWEATLKDGGKLIWFSSPYLFSDNFIQSNSQILAAALQQIGEKPNAVSLVGKAVPTSTLDVSQGDITTWFIVMVVAVPLIFLITGFVVWFLRRRR